jgi:hypothetical protein
MRINRKKWDSITFQDIYLTFLLNFRNEKEIRKKRMRKTRVYMQKPTIISFYFLGTVSYWHQKQRIIRKKGYFLEITWEFNWGEK